MSRLGRLAKLETSHHAMPWRYSEAGLRLSELDYRRWLSSWLPDSAARGFPSLSNDEVAELSGLRAMAPGLSSAEKREAEEAAAVFRQRVESLAARLAD